MIESLYADIGYQSLTKSGEIVCGDHIEQIRQPDGSVVLVLADGLGSGVKACILSTLTATITSRMVAGNLAIPFCVRSIAEALPVCSVRELAYSTFTIIRISPTGSALIVQYDNPCIALIRNGQEVPISFVSMTIDEKRIESAYVQLQKGDVLLTFSDGAENAGVGYGGMSYSNRWGRDNIVRYMEPLTLAGFSAKTLNAMVLDECYKRYEGQVGDDTTVLTVCMRTRDQINVAVGPPANLDDNEKMMSLFFSKRGKHIVCGGTTAKVAAAYLGKPVLPAGEASDGIPPISAIEGVDLTTEGIVTLNRVLDYAKDYLADSETYSRWCYKRDGASLLARVLFEEGSDINFFVGRAVNPAHQDPTLPISFDIKMRIIRELADSLKQMGKTLRINYF